MTGSSYLSWDGPSPEKNMALSGPPSFLSDWTQISADVTIVTAGGLERGGVLMWPWSQSMGRVADVSLELFTPLVMTHSLRTGKIHHF